jgi:betaine-aldehyde dehydrogenase
MPAGACARLFNGRRRRGCGHCLPTTSHDKAAAAAPSSVFENSGQDCCARSRILVEASVYDRFMEGLEKSVKAYKVGDPTDEATEMGPLVSKKHLDRKSVV